MKEKFYNYIQDMHDKITPSLEKVNTQAISREDLWSRAAGGGARTQVVLKANNVEQ